VRDEKPLFWRRVHLYPDGDLLAVVTGYGLVRLNHRSELVWAAPCFAHHDLDVTGEGTIYCLTWRKNMVPRINKEKKIREDCIQMFDGQGRELKLLSLLEAFENSPYRPFLDRMPRSGHTLHTNTLEIFDGSQAHRSPLFRKGNALVSMRSLDVIAIVDIDQGQVVWALTGQWLEQHQPTLLSNGNMLLFDNCGHTSGSQVIEFDPFTQQVAWAYQGDKDNGFNSPVLGSCSRLPNNNTLITDSVNGRAFEVTPAGRTVWEYFNPARAANDETLIATLLEIQRIDPDTLGDWLSP